MDIGIVGDFSDPLSFLASQRVEQIKSLGLHQVHWMAVEADRGQPVGGRPLQPASIQALRQLSLPGEALPTPGLPVPNSRAAAAAYAESISDCVGEVVRRTLFDALWVHGRDIGDPAVIRSVVGAVLNPVPSPVTAEWRIRANQLIVPLGDSDPFVGSRRLGFLVSTGRGPLTLVGQRRLDTWRELWRRRGAPTLPLLLTDLGEAFNGEHALRWLADQLPHAARTAPGSTPATSTPAAREPAGVR